MHSRAGRVHEAEGAGTHAVEEPRRAAGFAERHGAGLEHADEAFADQHVALHAGDWHADEMQVFGAVGDDGGGGRHGDTAIVGGYRHPHPGTYLCG